MILTETLWKLDSEKEGLDELYRITTGTHKVASLTGVSYKDIVNKLGEPSINVASEDDKVQVEWVFYYDGDNVFTLYDWKTYDLDYTKWELRTWSIGGHNKNHEFEDLLTNILGRKANIL